MSFSEEFHCAKSSGTVQRPYLSIEIPILAQAVRISGATIRGPNNRATIRRTRDAMRLPEGVKNKAIMGNKPS
jgi:hypothetical protein